MYNYKENENEIKYIEFTNQIKEKREARHILFFTITLFMSYWFFFFDLLIHQ